MPAKKYTDEKRAQALGLFVEHGAAEAARLTGVPQPTISSWAHREGVQSVAPAKNAQAVEAARLKWEERRATLADEFGEAAAEFIQHARNAIRDDTTRARDVQALLTAAAIGVDKAQLLAGGATSRQELDVTDPAGRLAAVHQLKEQASKRTAEGGAA